jgi:molybdate transport system regulatory protein
VWLEKRDQYAFGWGIAEILAAVKATGSIKEAAKTVGKSYRYVWSRVKDAESALGCTLVHTRVGGAGVQRSELTDEADDLLRNYTELRDAVMELVASEFAARFGG